MTNKSEPIDVWEKPASDQPSLTPSRPENLDQELSELERDHPHTAALLRRLVGIADKYFRND